MPTRCQQRCAVIGVGNPLMTDDGIGEAVLLELDRLGAAENVRLVNAGADPLRVLQELGDLDRALVVDAAEMQLDPGAVRVFGAQDVRGTACLAGGSVHGIDLNAVVELARRLGLAGKLRFLAVQSASLEPGAELSPALQACLPQIVERARQEIGTQSGLGPACTS